MISLRVALASAPFVFWAYAQVYTAPVKVDPVRPYTPLVKVDPVRPYTSPISSFTPGSGGPEVIGPTQEIALSVCIGLSCAG